MSLFDLACLLAFKHRRHRRPIVTFDEGFLFWRFEFRADEMDDHSWRWAQKHAEAREDYSVRPRRLPWWLPINAFVHCWRPRIDSREAWHDHPRWSITLCLRGRIIERTPWSERALTPGSFVFRTHRCIHSFEVPNEFRGKTWTLFIVGRRKHRQNKFVVMPQ